MLIFATARELPTIRISVVVESVSSMLNAARVPCSGPVAFKTLFTMVILMVPSVSVGLSTVIADVNAPRGVLNPATFDPFLTIVNSFWISSIDNLNPKAIARSHELNYCPFAGSRTSLE